MQLHGHHMFAEHLQRLSELDLATVDGQTAGRERFGDVRARHRTEQRVLVAHAPRNGDLERDQPRGQRLGFHDRPRRAPRPWPLCRIAARFSGRHREGQLAGQQVVARVPVGDLGDLAALAQVLDVLFQHRL